MAKKSKELKLDMDAINNQHIIDVDLNSEMKKAYICLLYTSAQVMGREKRATDGRPYKITN